MGRSRYHFHEEYYPYFITSTAKGGLPLFAIPEVAQIVLNNLEFIQKHRGLTLYGYVIMENHFHAVVQGENLSEKLRLTKSYMARKIIDFLKNAGKLRHLEEISSRKLVHKTHSDFQVWEEGLHPKQITTADIMVQKLEYIHYNPVNRGYVDKPEDWRYSSARNYIDKSGLISISRYSG